MRYIMILFLLLAACQTIQCDQKITCDDGRVFPSEHIFDGECVRVEYPQDPCYEEPECMTDDDCIPQEPMMGAQYLCEEGKCVQKALGNPASEKCKEDGGLLEMRENDNGTYGVCIMNGKECEEWAYYRGECSFEEAEQSTCGKESPENRAECCARENPCDMTELAVYKEDFDECVCEPIDIKRSCAAVQCDKNQFSIYDVNIGRCICVEAGTRQVMEEPKTEKQERTTNMTAQRAKELVILAFDEKWRKIPGYGKYEDGLVQPDEVRVYENRDGSYRAEIAYYAGQYFDKPDEPDHRQTLTVTEEGEVLWP